MDRKSIIILVAAVLLLLALSPIVDHFYPPKPVPLDASVGVLTNAQPGNVAFPRTMGSNAATVARSLTTTAPGQSRAADPSPSAPEQTLTVTNEDLIFQFTSHGGGLKTVWLRKYPAIISRTGDTSAQTNMATLNAKAPAPVLALLGNDTQGDNYFNLTQNGPVVTAEKTLANGLRLVKEFDIGTNYMFTARVRLENTSAQPLKIPGARSRSSGRRRPLGRWMIRAP